jgi:hypothetical protein
MKNLKLRSLKLVMGMLIFVVSLTMQTKADADVVLSNLPNTPSGLGYFIGNNFFDEEYRPFVAVDIPIGQNYRLNSFTADLFCFVCPGNVTLTLFEANQANEVTRQVAVVGSASVPNDVEGTLYTINAPSNVVLESGKRYLFQFSTNMTADPNAASGWTAHGSDAIPTGVWAYIENGSYNAEFGYYIHNTTPATVEIDATAIGGGGGGGVALRVPYKGMIQISTSQRQVSYIIPGTVVWSDKNGNPSFLPHDADGGGSDTYIITGLTTINNRTWVSIFLGSEDFVWVPLDSVTLLSPLPPATQ